MFRISNPTVILVFHYHLLDFEKKVKRLTFAWHPILEGEHPQLLTENLSLVCIESLPWVTLWDEWRDGWNAYHISYTMRPSIQCMLLGKKEFHDSSMRLQWFKNPQTLIFTQLPEWLFSSSSIVLELPSTSLSCSTKNSVKNWISPAIFIYLLILWWRKLPLSTWNPLPTLWEKNAHKFSATRYLSMWFPCDDILQTTCNKKTTNLEPTKPTWGKRKIIFKSALRG